MKLVAERKTDTANRSFTVRTRRGEYVASLSFRHVCALAAADQGRVTTVERRRSWYGMCDTWLEPHTDLYGIGAGTIEHLQFEKLVKPCKRKGQTVALTALGRDVLAAIRLAGVDVLLSEPVGATRA